MKFVIRPAKEFSLKERKAFKKIVVEANEVSEETFDGLIEKNPFLLFCPNTTTIEAVGALKIPSKSYKEKVFRKSQTALNPDNFDYELGWIVCLEEGKGIGQKITEILANYKTNIYATVRVENEKMNHIIKKFGFTQSGKSYDSDRGEYKINLFVKSE